MKIKMLVCIFLGTLCGLFLFLVSVIYADTTEGKVILSESAVWKTYVVWGPVVCVDASGAYKTIRSTRDLQLTDVPPSEWTNSDYDDSEWGEWREVHAPPQSMQGTSELLYDPWQYGIHQALILRRRCLRGKFIVDEPSRVKWLKLKVVYRGGIAVFINGKQIALGHLSAEAAREPAGFAEAYTKEIYYNPEGKLWELRSGNIHTFGIKNAVELENFNRRLRKLTVDIPITSIRNGINVLAIDVRRAPYPEGIDGSWWSTCGIAAIEMRGEELYNQL